MEQLRRDVVFGLRMLRKRPGTTAMAVLALALGIGLTTTMFSIVNGVFLRGLPFPDGDRVMSVGRTRLDRPDGQRPGSSTVDDLIYWRASQTSFESLAAYSQISAAVSSDGIAAVRFSGAKITPNLLGQLRVAPAIGRGFVDADAQPGAPKVALIADSVWTVPFGRDPRIIGRIVRLNGEATEIIGVMPPKFGFPQVAAVWTPLVIQPAEVRSESPRVSVIGHLKPGVSERAANTELAAIAARLAAAHTENKNVGAAMQPFVRGALGSEVIGVLSAMLAAVFGVLLIACVNVTNLQLARAADRTREIGIRMAMGASRSRLIRQLLVEGLLLSVCGAVIGVAIAVVGCRLFMAGISSTNPPFWIDTRVDVNVLLFTMALVVIAALSSSLVPAFRVTRQHLHDVLKDSGRGNTSLTLGRFSRVLVVAEMALSSILLVVSGLMVRGVVETGSVVYPFRTDVFTARLNWPEREYPKGEPLRQVSSRLLDQMTRTSGVTGVTLATDLPDFSGSNTITPEGRPAPATAEAELRARRISVTTDFFRTLRIPLRAGRLFTDSDREGALPVAVVSEDFVATIFPDGSPIGRRVRLGVAKGEADPWWTIVGVVPRVTPSRSVSDGNNETVFVPFDQWPERTLRVMAVGTGDAAALGGPLRSALSQINPDVALYNIDTIAGTYRSRSWPLRVFGSLFMSFGAAALFLSAAGLYGVMAFAVRRRTQEIGVRMALGAEPGAIIRMVLRQGAVMALIGIVLGIGGGGKLGALMGPLLSGVNAWDPLVFGLTIGVLTLTSVLASLIPARRAASIDPIKALQES